MKHCLGAEYHNIRLRPLEKRDIENLRIWRNDSSKTKYLRKIGKITPEMQEKWFESYLENQDEIIFAIEETAELNRMIGSVALYNFNGNMAEVGKIQIGASEANGRGIGGKSMVMAMAMGFQKLGLEKIVASVHQENLAAHKSYMRIGFKIVGKHPAHIGGYEDEIEMTEKALLEANRYIQEINIF